MPCCGQTQRVTVSGGQSIDANVCGQNDRVAVRYTGKLRQIRIEGGHHYGMHGNGDVFCMYPDDAEKVKDNTDFAIVG